MDGSASDNRRLALAVLTGLAVLHGIKLWLAWQVPLFGDEAFYWLESRHPAPAYSDLPFLTAMLVRAGTALAGDTYFGVRLPFLLLGMAVPALAALLARQFGDRRTAWWAAGATGCLPLAAMLGVLALPDAALVVLGLAGLLSLVKALRGANRGWWLAAGACAALGLCTHYRFAALLAGPALYMVAAPGGRRWLATPWPWLAGLVALTGLVPLAWFNLAHDFAGLSFQFVERHPWSFQAEGWRFLPVQALVTTPLLFIALAAAWLHARRQAAPDPGAGLVAAFSAVLVAGFAIAAFFADTERTSAHWPLAGYLPLLAWLPAVLRDRSPIIRVLVPLTGALGTLAMAGYLALAVSPGTAAGWTDGKSFPDNFTGWRAAARRAGALSAPGDVLVAGNFMLAAELDFELAGTSRVYSLDHPLNARHGRRLQMSIWSLDETALMRREAGRRAVVVIEESALRIGEQPAWARRVCRLFDAVDFAGEVSAGQGLKRFLYFTGTVRSRPAQRPTVALPTERCDLPPHAYLVEPRPGARLEGETRVHGWAVEDNAGIAEVALMVDGSVVAATRRFHDYPDVARFLPGSVDPRHPRVGFSLQWDTSGLAPGDYRVALWVTTVDGNERALERRTVRIAAGNTED